MWKDHFERLFHLDTDIDVVIVSDGEVCDDIEEAIFNAEITEEEIVRSIKQTNINKSVGPDEIPPGFFIYSY